MTHIRPLEAGLLWPAQLRVLAAVADGSTNADAARHLGRAEGTIKVTLTSIREALGALNTIHAVALMDDHCPGWRPRLALPARPADFSKPARFWLFGPGTGRRRAGAA